MSSKGKSARKVYEEAVAQARKIRDEAGAQAFKAEEEAVAPARKAYEDAEHQAWEIREAAFVQAFNVEEEAVAQARKAYEEATGMPIGIGVKPGERASIGGVSYVALIPHRILKFDLHKDLFLVEYPENGMKTEWVSIKDLEERGVIRIIKSVEG